MSSILTLAGNNTSSGFYPHSIDQSLRFEDGDSAHLSRTPSSTSNRKTWTWSAWVKRGNISNDNQTMWRSFGASGATGDYIFFNSDDTIYLGSYNSGHVWRLITSAVFRDVSSFYHIVASVDTTQSNSSSRAKLYINGQQVTEFGTETYPSLSYDTYTNFASPHYLGIRPDVTDNFDGYMSEVNLIDGSALGPDSFGETKDGIWVPKNVSGLTFGQNGFHLDFADDSAIGNDVSGNDNDWTPSGLAATDVVLDSPTNNFAVLNVLTKGTSNMTLAEGNLKANAIASGSGSNWGTVFSSIALPTTGKYYVEGLAFINTGSGNSSHLGVLDTSSFAPAHNNATHSYTTGEGFDGIYVSLFNNNAQPVSDGVLGTAEGSLTGTTVVAMLAVDIDNGKVWAGYDGTWLNSGDPSAGTNEIATRTFTNNDAIAVGIAYNGSNDQGMFANFGQDSSFAGNKTSGSAGASDANGQGDFFYTPPAGGFLALCSANLPEPSIISGEDYFNTVLYSGNSGTQAITGVGFQPDWVWMKARSNTYSHGLFDSVRGATKKLYADATHDERTESGLTSFDADGFTLGSAAGTNNSGNTYVSWNWLTGGPAVSNSDGSITSNVSANPEAGFSIVSWSGNNTDGATVGHGLSSAPEMVINKSRSATSISGWHVFHKDLTANYNALLDTNTAAWQPASTGWLGATTNSIFTLENGSSNGANVNPNGVDMITYCFHSVEGYSKVGMYVGNSSASGTYVHTGFKVSWLMVKDRDNTGSWYIWDDKRSPHNEMSDRLVADLTAIETADREVDFLSNGFKLRESNNAHNTSGREYIFLAFGSSPAKFSNAK